MSHTDETQRASYKVKSGRDVGTLIITNQRIMFQTKKRELMINAFYDKKDAMRDRIGGFEIIIGVQAQSGGFRKKDNKLILTLNTLGGDRPIVFDTEPGQANMMEAEIKTAHQERKKDINQMIKTQTTQVKEPSLNSNIPANIPEDKIWHDTWYDKEFEAYVSLNENLRKDYDYKTELYEKYMKQTGIDAVIIKKELVEMIFDYPAIIHPTNKKEFTRYRIIPTIPENSITWKIVEARANRVFAGDIRYDTEATRTWDRMTITTHPMTEKELQVLTEGLNTEYHTKEERTRLLKEGDSYESWENTEFLQNYKKDIIDGLVQWFKETKTTVDEKFRDKCADEIIELMKTMNYQQYKDEIEPIEHECKFQCMPYAPHSFRRVKIIEIEGQKVAILAELPNEVAVYLDENMANEHMARCFLVEKTWRILIQSELSDSLQREEFATAIIKNDTNEAKKIRGLILEEKFESEKYHYSAVFPKAYDLALAIKDEFHIKTLENS